MADDIFTPTGEPAASALETLVGEGKKFADAEALAKGKTEADGFIETLKQEKQVIADELAALKGKDDGKATVADLIKAVQDGNAASAKPEGDKPMSEADFQEKVRTITQGDRLADQRAANRAEGQALVLGKEGIDDPAAAKTYIAERATALGTTSEKLGELSEESPTAFAKLMEIDPSKSPKGATSLPGQQNTQALNLAPKTLEVDGHHTKSFYDAIRVEKGAKAWINDSRMQTRMAKDMAALGDKFNQ